jgi:hypothetical protein
VAIHVDVSLELNRRQLDRDSARLQRDLSEDWRRVGANSGAAFGDQFNNAANPRIRKATQAAQEAADALAVKESDLTAKRQKQVGVTQQVNKLESDLANIRKEAVRDTEAESAVIDKLNRSRLTQANVVRQVAQAHAAVTKAANDLDNRQLSLKSLVPDITPDVSVAVTQIGRLEDAFTGMASKISIPGAAGAGGLVALVATLVEAGGVAASASQALWLLPAAAGAAGAAFGTLALATQGFSSAVKDIGDPNKFAADLQNLSPAAQQAALSLRGLMPEFDQLRSATQNALFDGVGQQFTELANTFGPTVQKMTTGIATDFNQMFKGIAGQLMTPETQGAIQTFATNTEQAFRNIAPAVAPITKAITEVMAAGSSALPQLATMATNAAKAFSEFIDTNSRNGNITKWMNEGLDTIRQLVPAAESLARDFFALAPVGQAVLPNIVKVMQMIEPLMPAIGAAAVALGPSFGVIATAAHGVEMAVRGFGDAFKAIQGIVTTVANAIIPVINSIANAVSAAMAPIRVMIDAANLVPGVNIPQIPDYTPIAQIGSGTPAAGGGPGAQAQRRGAGVQLPNAGIPTPGNFSVPGGLGSSLQSSVAHPSGWQESPYGVTGPGGGGGGSSPSAASSSAAGSSKQQIADMIISSALARGYSMDTARGLVAYAIGESGLNPRANGGVQGDDSAIGLFQEKTAFSGGLTAEQRMNPQANINAYLNQFAQHQGAGDIEHQLFATSVGGPFYTGGYPAMRGLEGQADKYIAGYGGPQGSPGTDFSGQGTQQVAVQSFGPQAESSLNQQIGSKLDNDFGISKGLPGIVENATKALANLAMAPVLGQLAGVSKAFGTAGPGTGILGAFAPRQNMFGQQMPNILGQYPQQDGQPGQQQGYAPQDQGYSPSYGSMPDTGIPGLDASPSTSPGTSPASGTPWASPGAPSPAGTPFTPTTPATPGVPGTGTLPGPWGAPPGITPQGGGQGVGPTGAPLGPMSFGGPAPGANPFGPLATSTSSTAQRGIELGHGMPASGGIGFSGGGILGAAETAAQSAISAAGSAAGVASGGGGGAGGAAASAAAQIGFDEINRAIGAGAQIAGIGVEGLMQTFLPVESELADPTRGWGGRILAGIAGARPAAPNIAGKLGGDPKDQQASDKALKDGKGGDQPLTPEQVKANQDNRDQSQTSNNTTINVTGMPHDQTGVATQQAYDAHQANQNQSPSPAARK